MVRYALPILMGMPLGCGVGMLCAICSDFGINPLANIRLNPEMFVQQYAKPILIMGVLCVFGLIAGCITALRWKPATKDSP